MRSRFEVLALCALLAACGGNKAATDGDGFNGGNQDGSTGNKDGGSSQSGDQPSALDVLSPTYDKVVVEVDYQSTAAPYTGSSGTVNDLWTITEDNLARAFQKSPKTLTVPHQLSDMQSLSDVSGTTFTTDQILAIAKAHRDTPPQSGKTVSYYVVFLDGYLQDDGGAEMQVIGVSIGNTGVVAMFKPVIESTMSLFPGVEKYVEQSTMVHELGHALGLVNNGVPMAAPHQDTAHGAHCTNDKCTMYWENEGASSAASFAQQMITTGSTILFAAECLADLDAVAH